MRERLAQQAREEAERKAKEQKAREEAERKAREEADRKAWQELQIIRTRAAIQIQTLVRGSMVRGRLKKARQKAQFVDDDDFDYIAVDEDFLPDIAGLEALEKPLALQCEQVGLRSPGPVPRIIIDTAALKPATASNDGQNNMPLLPDERMVVMSAWD